MRSISRIRVVQSTLFRSVVTLGQRRSVHKLPLLLNLLSRRAAVVVQLRMKVVAIEAPLMRKLLLWVQILLPVQAL